jgi:hypothetical protein
MRIATNDAPVRYLLDEAAAAYVGLDIELLVTQTEFGVSVAWRENKSDTWSAPIALVEVAR